MNFSCENYIIHVKKGFEQREKSIIDQFAALDLPFEWVLEHDKNELTDDILAAYKYSGALKGEEISCSLKHIAAWEKIASGRPDAGFVFEDDVLINRKKFKPFIEEALAEFHRAWKDCGCISLGDGMALHVPWTKRKKGRRLYRADHIRAADSYWINKETARRRVEWVKDNGFTLPADHLINTIDARLNIPILWLEPTVVSQGSHTGLFPSSIQAQDRGTMGDRIEWMVKKFRRKYLFPLLGIDLRIFKKKKWSD
jgi:glycosyl transferase family 25